MWLLRILVVGLAAATLFAAPVAAHLTPNSEVRLAIGADTVLADIVIPQGDYAAATGHPVGNDPRSLRLAKEYLQRSVGATVPGGKAWTMEIRRIAFETIAGPPDLHATVRLRPPSGASPRRFDMHWRAVIGEVPGHFVLFVVDTDFGKGKLDDRLEIAGSLQGDRTVLRIDRGAPSLWRGFGAAFASGMHHIAIGYDHMLFLLVVLLPLPLVATGGAWTGRRPVRQTLYATLAVVTAFTIGHSLTLILASAFDLQLPVQPVEIGIALSILVSAIHAWRPLFPGREALVAGLFGLIHGLAFATLITRIGVGLRERVLAILGFNLGIEAAQLVILGAALPLLILAMRSRRSATVRRMLAAVAMVLALAWLVERSGGPALLG